MNDLSPNPFCQFARQPKFVMKIGLGKPVDPEEWMIHAILRDSLALSHSRKNLGTLKVDRKSVDIILGIDVHCMRVCISSITGREEDGDIMVVHLARSMRLTYAGAVNLVERNRTA